MAASTPAIAALTHAKIPFELRTYAMDEKGALPAAEALGVEPRVIGKTLVVEVDGTPHLVVVRGDHQLALKDLARELGAKVVAMAEPSVAERLTGYLTGGISPWGTRKPLPTLYDATIDELPQVGVNGGRRGYIVFVTPRDLVSSLRAQPIYSVVSMTHL